MDTVSYIFLCRCHSDFASVDLSLFTYDLHPRLCNTYFTPCGCLVWSCAPNYHIHFHSLMRPETKVYREAIPRSNGQWLYSQVTQTTIFPAVDRTERMNHSLIRVEINNCLKKNSDEIFFPVPRQNICPHNNNKTLVKHSE